MPIPDAGEGAAEAGIDDGDVFARTSDADGFHAAAGFDGDGVVTRVDVAFFDADVLAGVDVDAVAVALGFVGTDVEIFGEDVFAVSKVDAPHAAVLEGKVFDAQVFAVDGFKEGGSAGIAQEGEGGVADDSPLAEQGNVLGVVGVDERAVTLAPAAFPANVHERVVLFVGAAGDGGVFLDTQRRVRGEMNAADKVIARGHDDFAAAGESAGVEGFLESGGVFGFAVTGRAEVADVEWCFAIERGGLGKQGEGEGDGNAKQ